MGLLDLNLAQNFKNFRDREEEEKAAQAAQNQTLPLTGNMGSLGAQLPQAQTSAMGQEAPEMPVIPPRLSWQLNQPDDGLSGYGRPINLYAQPLMAYRGDFGPDIQQRAQAMPWLVQLVERYNQPNPRLAMQGLMGIDTKGGVA
jgi:hypothetical protein